MLHVLSEGPMDLVAIDLHGPMVTSARNNRYIVVMRDIFTRYTVIAATKDASAEELARVFIDHWIAVLGIPSRLLTDNAKIFSSATMEDFYVLLKIRKIWTSPYRPQTDGSVERMNRVIDSMLSHYVNAQQDNWDELISLVARLQ